MVYLITALDAEARPIIEHYRLKRSYALPYTLYSNDSMVLLVTQVGSKNAMMALSSLLGWRKPDTSDILINIGICGGPEIFPIGEPLLVHQIIDDNRHYYPDILYAHSLHETPLLSVDTPKDIPLGIPVDMESSGIFQAASRFFKIHQIAFLKIVSDHFNPESVTKDGVITLIKNQLSTIDFLIAQLQGISDNHQLFTSEERDSIEHFKTHFTKSQSDSLEDALTYYRLKSPEKPLIFPSESLPSSKRERSKLHEHLIATLTA